MKEILIEKYKGNLTDSVYEVNRVYDDGYYEKEINLVYSKIGNWTQKGKKAYTLKQDGYNVTFKDHYLKKSFSFDFAQYEALLKLVKLIEDKVDFEIFLKKEDK
jgi:hypothetical protein